MPTSPSRRTLVPLTGTFRRLDFHLSLPAYAALQVASQRLSRHHQLRPTVSAVGRAALLHYCKHLQAMSTPELESEARHVCNLSKVFKPHADDVARTMLALEMSGEGAPLPTLEGVLQSPSEPLDLAALDAKVVSMLKSMHPRRYKDLR